MSDEKPKKKTMKVKTTKATKKSDDGSSPKKSPKKKSTKTPKTTKDGETPKLKKKVRKSDPDAATPRTGSKKKTTSKAKSTTAKSTKAKSTKSAGDSKKSASKTKKKTKESSKDGAASPKKTKKKKKDAAEAAPVPEIPKVDPAVQRKAIETEIKRIREDLAKQKRLTARGEQELESLKRNFCIKKAMQSHINDATLREHDELIEDMIDTLYEYEEHIEQFEVLAESFAENFEDAKADLGFDLEAQGKLYAEQAQMLQEFADDITESKEKYTEEIEEARKLQKKLVRENEGLQALLSDVQSSLDGGEGLNQRLFDENRQLEKEITELQALLEQAAATLKNKSPAKTKKEAAQAKAIQTLQSDNTRLMNDISKLKEKMVEAVAKQEEAQAAYEAAGGGSKEDEEEMHRMKQMKNEVKELQKMMKDVDKKLAKAKIPKRKSEVAEMKELEARGKKLTAELKKARAEKKTLAVPQKLPDPSEQAEPDPAKIAELEREAAELESAVAAAKAEAEEMASAAEAETTPGDGPTMQDLRNLAEEIQAGDAEVEEKKKQIKRIEKEMAESKAEGGSIDDKLKKIRKAIKAVQKDLAGVEKEAQKQEARNQDKLKKARKKYGGVGKTAKRVSDAFKKLSQSTRALAGDVREIFENNLPFITKKMERLVHLVNTSGEDSNKAIAKYNKEFMLRKGFHNKLQELRGNIRVFARCRPILPFEKKRGATVCVEFPMPDTLQVRDEKRNTTNTWEFDKVFKPGSENMDVFKEISPLVTSILDGYNVCIFAYGQTGAGKTYTMEGKGEDKGLNWRTLDTLFALKEKRAKQFKIDILMSFLEIYNEEIKDLLNAKKKGGAKLKVKMLKGGGNEIPGLVQKPVNTVADLDAYVEEGKKRRTCKKTKMNDSSSRSHAVLSIYCTCLNKMSKKVMNGKLHLIDLAGSERLDKSGATGQALKEAIHINKSLSALGDVIAARANKSGHCPYRNSALTHVLEDSLAGDSKTLMLSQISPATDNAQESACTLRFASRVRKVELGRASAHGEGGGEK
eukprot:INCI15817.2.p1 GENE.INCI15817.2~~INCI15817.2.p1  ORF type:complete len:1033 (-),score=324.57 INCI15817.2:3273-6371(-)